MARVKGKRWFMFDGRNPTDKDNGNSTGSNLGPSEAEVTSPNLVGCANNSTDHKLRTTIRSD